MNPLTEGPLVLTVNKQSCQSEMQQASQVQKKTTIFFSLSAKNGAERLFFDNFDFPGGASSDVGPLEMWGNGRCWA